MRSLILHLLLLFAMVSSADSARAESFLGVDAARLRRVIDLCYDMDPAAVPEIDALAREHPDSPVPELLRVQRLYWLRLYAESDRALSEQFEHDGEVFMEKAVRLAKERAKEPDAVIVGALSQLSMGLYYLERGRIWAAFWKVRAGRHATVRLLENHPDYTDAKMPVGLAECFLERTPGYLKPLAVFIGGSGDMQAGLAKLTDARDHGLLTSVEASFYLAQIRFDLLHDIAGATAEMRTLAERFPHNPFFQRLLAYGETQTGAREAGWARYRAAAELDAARAYPALAVRPLMMFCWDAMSARDYAEALRVSEEAATRITGRADLQALFPEIMFGQGEALKALGRYTESFARFEAIGPEFPDSRKRALGRVKEIKKEIGWKESADSPGRATR